MNRDVLVGTQPEVAGRLSLLWKYPPQLFVDEHENSGSNYFFPPDADPIYHETPNGLYQRGRAAVRRRRTPAAFKAHGWRYETWKSGYDFFAQVYGDTVPTTQMGAVGMTFEQGDAHAVPDARATPLHVRARHPVRRRDPPRERPAHVARHLRPGEGRRASSCRLEPNRIFNPGHDLQRQRAEAPGLRLLPARELARDQARGEPAPGRPRRRGPAGPPDRGPGLPPVRRRAATEDAAGRHVLDQPRPGAEALGAGGPQRGHLRAVPVLLRRERLEPAAARRHRGRLHRAAGDARRWCRVPTLRTPTAPSRRPAAADRGAGPVQAAPATTTSTPDGSSGGWPRTGGSPTRSSSRSRSTPRSLQQVRRPGRGERRLQAGVSTARSRGPRPLWRPGSHEGGRYVGWQEGALLASALGISQVGMDTPKAESPGALMRIRTPHGPQRDRVGQRLQPRPGARRRPGGRRLPAAACSSPASPRSPRPSPARPSRRSRSSAAAA